MKFEATNWNGFEGVSFTFEGNCAQVIKPRCKPNGKWALKTEYVHAFPSSEIELLNRGWHIAYNQNDNRWAENIDLERKGKFIKFVSEEFSLDKRCAMIGMSCGGLYAVKTTALYPELVSMLYLDAPVLNLLSCPCCMGVATDDLYPEYYQITGRTKSQMLSYRDNPIDKMDILLKHDIPILLVCGDSDTTVPYEENGMILKDYYEKNDGVIVTFLKKDCGHHPHGLENPKVACDIIEEFSK